MEQTIYQCLVEIRDRKNISSRFLGECSELKNVGAQLAAIAFLHNDKLPKSFKVKLKQNETEKNLRQILENELGEKVEKLRIEGGMYPNDMLYQVVLKKEERPD